MNGGYTWLIIVLIDSKYSNKVLKCMHKRTKVPQRTKTIGNPLTGGCFVCLFLKNERARRRCDLVELYKINKRLFYLKIFTV